jgi:hypothetical protein
MPHKTIEILMARLSETRRKVIKLAKKLGFYRKIGNVHFSLKEETDKTEWKKKDCIEIKKDNQSTPTIFQLRQISKDRLTSQVEVFFQPTAENKPADESSKAKEYLNAADVKGKERLEVIALLNRGEVTAIDVAEAYKDLMNTAKEYKDLMDKLKKSGAPQNAEWPAIEHAAQTEEEMIKKAKLQQANKASETNQNASLDKDLPDINVSSQGTSDGLKLEQDVEIALQLARDFINSSVMSTFDKIMLMAILRTGSVTIEDVAKVQNADKKRGGVNRETVYLHEFTQEESDRIDGIMDLHMQVLFNEMKELRAEREMEAKETDRVENLTNRDMQKVFMSLDKLIAKREAKATKAPTYQEASTQPLSEEEMDRGENIMGKHLDELFRRMDERRAKREAKKGQ